MKKVRDKPLLYYLINQLKQCKIISKLIIAITTFKEDDIISDLVSIFPETPHLVFSK